jgi:hypothetical protein
VRWISGYRSFLKENFDKEMLNNSAVEKTSSTLMVQYFHSKVDAQLRYSATSRILHFVMKRNGKYRIQ